MPSLDEKQLAKPAKKPNVLEPRWAASAPQAPPSTSAPPPPAVAAPPAPAMQAPPIGGAAGRMPQAATPAQVAQKPMAPPAPMLQVTTPGDAKIAAMARPGSELEGASSGSVPMAKAGQQREAERQGNKLTEGLVRNQGAEAGQPTFDREAANVARPSNFVGFNAFAGLNADTMKSIADRAALATYQLRNQADGALREATAAAQSSGQPLESTPAFKRYRELMAKAGQAQGGGESRYAGNLSATGNPYEDSLRQLYAPSQRARENASQSQLGAAGDWAKSYDAGMRRDEATARADVAASDKAREDAAKKAAENQGAAVKKTAAFNKFVGQVRSLGNESVQYDELLPNEQQWLQNAFASGLPVEDAVRQLTSLMALRGK